MSSSLDYLSRYPFALSGKFDMVDTVIHTRWRHQRAKTELSDRLFANMETDKSRYFREFLSPPPTSTTSGFYYPRYKVETALESASCQVPYLVRPYYCYLTPSKYGFSKYVTVRKLQKQAKRVRRTCNLTQSQSRPTLPTDSDPDSATSRLPSVPSHPCTLPSTLPCRQSAARIGMPAYNLPYERSTRYRCCPSPPRRYRSQPRFTSRFCPQICAACLWYQYKLSLNFVSHYFLLIRRGEYFFKHAHCPKSEHKITTQTLSTLGEGVNFCQRRHAECSVAQRIRCQAYVLLRLFTVIPLCKQEQSLRPSCYGTFSGNFLKLCDN